MYLAIVNDLDCRNRKVLREGSYAELSEYTTQYTDSMEIRKKFSDIVAAFEYEYKNSGHIVVFDSNRIGNKKYPHPRLKVLYKEDKDMFDKLLPIPQGKNEYYYNWICFWKQLKYTARKEQNGYYDTKLYPVRNVDIQTANFNKIINDKIQKYDNDFKVRAKQFTSYLLKISQWYYDDWNKSDNQFKTIVFRDFKRLLKNNKEVYYNCMNLVTKAYKVYKERNDYIYNVECLGSIKVTQDPIDNTENTNHSLLYQHLYYYIASQDREYIKNYFESNPNSWQDLTKEEMKEIRELIKPLTKIK